MGRDVPPEKVVDRNIISIHSPRMGRDPDHNGPWVGDRDFNPLSPHGERRRVLQGHAIAQKFQSTLPAWGETLIPGVDEGGRKISIHSPRMGRDGRGPSRPQCPPRFQSTLPAWGETIPENFLSPSRQHFNPLSPHGERQCQRHLIAHGMLFQSTLPAWGETEEDAE